MVSTSRAETRIRVAGCPVDVVTLAEAVERAEAAVAARAPIQHVAINAAKVVKYRRDPRFARPWTAASSHDGGRPARRLGGARARHAASRARHRHRPHGGAPRRGRPPGDRVFFLGARPEVLTAAERAIRERFPALVVAGRHHGYFKREEEDDVVDEIAAARPDFLFVALETPAKELFLARHRGRLGIPFVMGVGGSIDVWAGLRSRAPHWMGRLGLEWLYRLAQDPRRLARRYVVGNATFVWLVLSDLVRGPGTRGRARSAPRSRASPRRVRQGAFSTARKAASFSTTAGTLPENTRTTSRGRASTEPDPFEHHASPAPRTG